MAFYPDERIAIFIDGANLYSTVKGLDFDIDYQKLLDLFAAKGRLQRAYYYTAMRTDDDFSPLRRLIDWLSYNGYHIVTKPTKDHIDRDGRRKTKGNMDIEIAVDMIEHAAHIDHFILFTGDGDFRAAVEAVQRKGSRVSVVSTLKTKPPMMANELRKQADAFIELADLDKLIGRPKSGPDYEED